LNWRKTKYLNLS